MEEERASAKQPAAPALQPAVDRLRMAFSVRGLGKTGLTLEACATASAKDRTQFLATLREKGVAKQTDRQSFANAPGKATREGWLRPPYKGPFTSKGRDMREAREAQPNAVAPTTHVGGGRW